MKTIHQQNWQNTYTFHYENKNKKKTRIKVIFNLGNINV